MKYNCHTPVSTYTRHSQYTPTYHTPTKYGSSHYTPSYTSASNYTLPQHGSTHYTPSYYTPSYRYASTYIPSRYSSTWRTQARENPAPVIPITPAKRTVHFPNDIIFQDVVRRGELEQIGRFIRTRKVRVDTLFHSGMAALHEAVLTGNLEVVKLLVKYGADVHQKDEDGWTPLHMACSDGFPEIASYLLSLGASTEAENENGEKPTDLIDPDCKELSKLFEVGCI
ncbi:protein phosphatase 1 regulatory subunit 27 [Corythoichthys intestinalis]|uniref:protein phosphatase 1 regulatory subunit 27 n=1 Tax=Corythoichthys intestinalis TaxID=161448 RepID=UPI0025A62003|nr:protein phosphatase 1 regulatory subunit 27 [Corythoichthys intestinalis]XP_061804880.1 protein phosphatase 1 regulatory subunit 27-like [Nerophis lumbriciformis]